MNFGGFWFTIYAAARLTETIQREYDQADRLIEEIQKDKENGIENKTQFTYDKAGNIIKITDANGAEEQYQEKHDKLALHIGTCKQVGWQLQAVAMSATTKEELEQIAWPEQLFLGPFYSPSKAFLKNKTPFSLAFWPNTIKAFSAICLLK